MPCHSVGPAKELASDSSWRARALLFAIHHLHCRKPFWVSLRVACGLSASDSRMNVRLPLAREHATYSLSRVSALMSRKLSLRIKRGLRSLALYGPRAIAKPTAFPQRGASSLAKRSATSRLPRPRSSAMAGRNFARG